MFKQLYLQTYLRKMPSQGTTLETEPISEPPITDIIGINTLRQSLSLLILSSLIVELSAVDWEDKAKGRGVFAISIAKKI